MPGALQNLLVVDLTSGFSGAYAGKLLRDLGARVILVEPAEGNPVRQRLPLPAGKTYSPAFAHLGAGKESIAPRDEADARELLDRLLRKADVLLTDGRSPWEDCLPDVRPERLVEVDSSPWGRSGPYKDWKGSDIATWAMSGYMYFTGDPDRAPLYVPGSQAELHASVHVAFSALVALHERRRDGCGQRIEVSELEAVLAAHAWLISSWEASGQPLPRTGHDFTKTKDGWALFMRMLPSPNVFLLIDQPDRMDDPALADFNLWREAVPSVYADVEAWAQDYTAVEVATKAQELRIACTPVLDTKGLDENIQFAERDWWESGEDAVYGRLRFPGQPYKLSATPSSRQGSAPKLDEHGKAIRAEFRDAERPAPPMARGTTDLPLAGIKVVEVTANWAGPILGRHFGDLGAEVYKVEWAQRPATRGLYLPGPTQDQMKYPYNRAQYFNEINRSKRDVCINLQEEEGRAVFKDLINEADILVENNSARVMPNLGLDYESLKKINPGLIYISMAGFGATGPWRDWSAYGSNIEGSSGLASLVGYDESQVFRTTLFYADPVAGNHGSVAALAALEERRRTGEGQYIDISLNEAGAGYFLDAIMDYQATGTVRRPMGNRDARFAPQGAYQCMGVDNWIALCVQSDEEWPRLCEVIARPDLADDASLKTLKGRQKRHDEIDEAIADWVCAQEQYEAAWALQRAGVSAAPVLANWQILPDPHIHERGFFQEVLQPAIGYYHYSSWPWRFSRTPARIRRAAPKFAEHNREILRELGYDEARIEALYASGVTADEPTLRPEPVRRKS